MKTKLFIFGLIIAALFTYPAKGQFIDDALRFSQPNGYVSSRAGGLNVAFHGLSDDFSALAFNPAGLSLVKKSEISFGFGFLRNSTVTKFLDNFTDFGSNDAYLSHAGIVAPFDTKYGNAAVAIGYILESNFDNDYKYSGFNPVSTFIDFSARNDGNDINKNLAGYLYLADFDNNGRIFTPIIDSLQQYGFVRENGGIHNITGGAGIDLSEFVSLGFSITGKWGAYNYSREYSETDVTNKYDEQKEDFSNVDFNMLRLEERLEQIITGITGSIGIQARIGSFMRFGAAVKFPTFYDIEESFSQEANAYFDDGGHVDPPYDTTGETSYKVSSPWVYSAGVSVHAAGITFAAGVEYSDVTLMEFSDATSEVEKLNSYIVQELVGQTTWGFGVEYDIPLLPIVVRGSLASTTSPYSKDVPGASIIHFSLGAGIYLAPNVRLDGLFRFSDLSQSRSNYGSKEEDSYIYTISPLNLGMQITYRY